MTECYTEESALANSTGWVRGMDGLYGYLPFSAANFLVGTGRYEFHQCGCWGYVVKRVAGVKSLA